MTTYCNNVTKKKKGGDYYITFKMKIMSDIEERNLKATCSRQVKNTGHHSFISVIKYFTYLKI